MRPSASEDDEAGSLRSRSGQEPQKSMRPGASGVDEAECLRRRWGREPQKLMRPGAASEVDEADCLRRRWGREPQTLMRTTASEYDEAGSLRSWWGRVHCRKLSWRGREPPGEGAGLEPDDEAVTSSLVRFRLAGLCFWAGSVEVTETRWLFVSANLWEAPGGGRDDFLSRLVFGIWLSIPEPVTS